MNTQLEPPVQGSRRGHLELLQGGRVLPLGATGGKLEVLHGRVWLTRAGDPDDHFIDFGHSLVVPSSGRALVAALDEDRPALVAWAPRGVGERVVAAVHAISDRCWEIVDPAPRIGAGALAAMGAVLAGALVFGPLSDARTRTLAAAGVLHNGGPTTARPAADARSLVHRPRADVSGGERAAGAAQEARRRAAGVA
ncbi:MAG: DUF2917 domain-containing protein [Rhizobacter sp.]|nr:DUF2917 domain-containing protein [Rhizobacter sp.]